MASTLPLSIVATVGRRTASAPGRIRVQEQAWAVSRCVHVLAPPKGPANHRRARRNVGSPTWSFHPGRAACCSLVSEPRQFWGVQGTSSSSRPPWWQPPKGTYNCAWPAVYRVGSGSPIGLGSCVDSFGITTSRVASIRIGTPRQVHMTGTYSSPFSSDPAVLSLSGQGDDGTTITFEAQSAGTAVISTVGVCGQDVEGAIGKCQVLQVKVD